LAYVPVGFDMDVIGLHRDVLVLIIVLELALGA
jgi:hypothetical protein